MGVVTVVGAYTAYWIAYPAGWSTAGTVVFVAAVVALLVLVIGGWVGVVPTFIYRKVARSGLQSPAAIVETWRTGNTSHDRGEVLSELKLLLEVIPRSGDRYRVHTKTMVTTADETAYRPGAILEVRYHPDWPRKVFVTGPYPPGSRSG